MKTKIVDILFWTSIVLWFLSFYYDAIGNHALKEIIREFDGICALSAFFVYKWNSENKD